MARDVALITDASSDIGQEVKKVLAESGYSIASP